MINEDVLKKIEINSSDISLFPIHIPEDYSTQFAQSQEEKGDENQVEETRFDKILKRAAQIVIEYKKYQYEELIEWKNSEIEKITKESQAQKILDKHLNEAKEELETLFTDQLRLFIEAKNFNLEYYLSKKDSELIDEINKQYDNKLKMVNDYSLRLINSLDLCENKQEVDCVLTNEHLINGGVIANCKDIKSKWYE